MEEWEEWEFARTTSDEEDRLIRRELTLRTIDKRLGRHYPASVPAAVAQSVVMQDTSPALRAKYINNETQRRIALAARNDAPPIPSAPSKRPYTEADARADRDRWMRNAKRIGGR